jgi:hypothetical protein
MIHEPGGDIAPRIALGAHRLELGSEDPDRPLFADGRVAMDGYLVKKVIERIQIGYRDLGGWMDGHGRRLQVGPRSTEPVNRHSPRK